MEVNIDESVIDRMYIQVIVIWYDRSGKIITVE
jgi:hypothetical protein